jgi:hypothetical protein
MLGHGPLERRFFASTGTLILRELLVGGFPEGIISLQALFST